MDIEYLLALQSLRESLGSGAEAALGMFSDYMMFVGLIACAIVYWCVHKKTGQFAMLCFSAANYINQSVKDIACVYRPWILDPRVTPAESAVGGATGYSFPSGHTVMAASTFGALAYSVRKKWPILAVVLVLLVLLEAFLRNFLGVHTPQDVLVGLLEAAVVVLVGARAYAWYEAPGRKKRDGVVVLVVLALCVLCLVVIELKSYPMDYVDGVLLVDPEAMKKDCYEGVGVLAGMFLGWYCERRWVNFSTDEISVRERVVRGIVGVVVLVVVFVGFDVVAKAVMAATWAKLTSRFVVAFVVMFVVPLLFAPLHKAFAKSGK